MNTTNTSQELDAYCFWSKVTWIWKAEQMKCLKRGNGDGYYGLHMGASYWLGIDFMVIVKEVDKKRVTEGKLRWPVSRYFRREFNGGNFDSLQIRHLSPPYYMEHFLLSFGQSLMDLLISDLMQNELHCTSYRMYTFQWNADLRK